MEALNQPVELECIKNRHALDDWLDDCCTRLLHRYPKIDFEADIWDPRKQHGSDVGKVNLATLIADFQGKDRSFADAIRCLLAEALLKGVKDLRSVVDGLRLLRSKSIHTLFELDLAELRSLEEQCLAEARLNPSVAQRLATCLAKLTRDLDTFYKKGVMPFLNYCVPHQTKNELSNFARDHSKKRRNAKASILDQQIEALNEAWNALADQDGRLTTAHQNALAVLGLELCAPSRVNEPLCMSIDDFAVIEAYAREECGPGRDQSYSAHQMLILTMKGSKGAQWSPKPVLSFMMQFFHYCMDVIKENGKSSRMLVEWYQKNPDKLYLPLELEHLRGQDLSVAEVYQIMQLDKNAKVSGACPARPFFKSRQSLVRLERRSKGRGKHSQVLPWREVESGLLEMVREAMTRCRVVTDGNHYQGDLAKMLLLFDDSEMRLPFVPGVFNAYHCGSMLKSWKKEGRTPRPTVFEVLGITMPVNGKVQTAYIESHDPRRWLTTMAKIHGSKLSDVLINKWANRLSLAQLWKYDFETLHSKAAKSAMPNSPDLEDLSKRGVAIPPEADLCGIERRFVEVHDIGVSVVGMDEIYNASKSRPRARTSEDLVVLYPNWYGCCAHAHHATPCRSYSACLPCGENIVVKGHLPTNDHIRERKMQLHGSIVTELKRLVEARKYEIADDQDKADAHIVALVRQGLGPEQMADHLIKHFHEIKLQIADIVFRNRLEEAFVATGYVELLDDPNKPSGANLKYINASRHAAPGLERGIQAHGGPEAILRHINEFAVKYPQFASQSPEQLNQYIPPLPEDEFGDDDADMDYE